ncbi:MAG: O-antigen ligase family protein [Candidatus Magasanikbacteria bacterium]|nr:O-antigen ligase family protein [Candidatus Magasanikbacteria bacterium]MBT4071957.1 O-antigen ligase family protein [Candidatus Magasanikbacteria bacterium]
MQTTDITPRSLFNNIQTFGLLGIFFIARVLSYMLMDHIILQGILVFAIMITTAALFFYKPTWGWYIVLGELFLGGTGHLFELYGLSLRTILLLTFGILWIVKATKEPVKKHLHISHRIFFFLILYLLYLGFSGLYGITNGHPIANVIQDLIPYAFFFFILPLNHLHTHDKIHSYIIRLLIVWLIGTALFALYNEIVFASNLHVIHDHYYTWLRDFLMAKITDMGTGFFRIVEPSHLLVAPAILLLSSLVMRKEKHHIGWYALLFFAYIILVLNFSRAYMLSIGFSFFILLYRHKFSQWIKVGTIHIAFFLCLLFSINLATSLGASTGLDLLGLRFGGIVAPSTEVSAYTRHMLLTPIFDIIKHQPILGTGVGETLVFLTPDTYEKFITRHFDWGYFEILAETGIIGLLLFIVLIGLIIFELISHIRKYHDYEDFHVGILAGLCALMIIQIFGPALNHIFGILFLSLCIVMASKQHNILEEIIHYIYRIFHRK